MSGRHLFLLFLVHEKVLSMGIAENISNLRAEIPPSVKIIAVSKTKPVSDILEAYKTGQLDFGENKVQELLDKHPLLPADIRWHMIGHLQSNKVRPIVPFIHMIHAVDSLKLLTVINSEAARINRVISCLLQIYIAREDTKFGLSVDEAMQLIESPGFVDLKNIRIYGLMGMATYTNDTEQVKREFRTLKECFSRFSREYFKNSRDFKELSMGMSGDYLLAAEEGSTMIRIGSLIFGTRK